jgi:hypothetical protein
MVMLWMWRCGTPTDGTKRERYIGWYWLELRRGSMVGIKIWSERRDRVAIGRLRGGGTPRNGDGDTARDEKLTRSGHDS